MHVRCSNACPCSERYYWECCVKEKKGGEGETEREREEEGGRVIKDKVRRGGFLPAGIQ